MAIQDLLKDKNEQIDYGSICKKYSWILEKNHCCVLSPDSDGLLCGLFMSKSLVWKIVGFYDGKVSVINKEYLISIISYKYGWLKFKPATLQDFQKGGK